MKVSFCTCFINLDKIKITKKGAECVFQALGLGSMVHGHVFEWDPKTLIVSAPELSQYLLIR